MKHSPRFEKLAADAKKTIRECDVPTVKKRLDRGDQFYLIDCREDHEWAQDHIPNAIHLGRGIMERDIESKVPDVNADIVIYCGGGFRSALAAENLQKMGYNNVTSMDGGIRGWRDAGFPTVKEKK